jgi:hypothetical protein
MGCVTHTESMGASRGVARVEIGVQPQGIVRPPREAHSRTRGRGFEVAEMLTGGRGCQGGEEREGGSGAVVSHFF